MLTEHQTASICHSLALGSPIAPLTRVTGGLLHSMFCLQTDIGRFAVKVLDRQIMEIPNIHASFRLSEIIATEVAAAGIPAVSAMSGKEGIVSDIGPNTVLVYPWIDGTVLPIASAGPTVAHQIGVILGRIHILNLDISRFGASERTVTDPIEWRGASDDGLAKEAPWADEIADLLPRIVDWENAGLQAYRSLGERRVVSHGDLDQKNVIWSETDTPWLIDWESAGPVVPAVEVIAAALDWSGQTADEPDCETFMALLAGYRSITDLAAQNCRMALHVRLADWLGWLKANMTRSTDDDRSTEEQELGTREVIKTAATLRNLASNTEVWAAWCE